MIIAIASDDGMHIAEHPGRCRGFVIFEVDRSNALRVGYRSNACTSAEPVSGTGEGSDEAPDLPYQPLVAALTDCGALVSRSMDGALLKALQCSVTSGYVCRGNGVEQVDEAARLFVRGQLQRMTSDAHRARR
jgi:hypothetical protein